jgi:hypothetical protein
MTALGLVVLIFVIVPGFIADTLFRSIRGMSKGGQFERILRALVWSVFGLGTYQLFLGKPPSYLAGLGAEPDVVLFHLTVLPLALHSIFSAAAAFVTATVAEDRIVRVAFMRAFSRSLNERSAWDVMWHEHRRGRRVRIERKDGQVYWGDLASVSSGSGKHEILLADPSVYKGDPNNLEPVRDARFLYVAEDEIAEIRLGLTAEEWNG